jgi:hypothetical protein
MAKEIMSKRLSRHKIWAHDRVTVLTFGEAPLPKLTRAAAFRNDRRYGANKRLEMNELTGRLCPLANPTGQIFTKFGAENFLDWTVPLTESSCSHRTKSAGGSPPVNLRTATHQVAEMSPHSLPYKGTTSVRTPPSYQAVHTELMPTACAGVCRPNWMLLVPTGHTQNPPEPLSNLETRENILHTQSVQYKRLRDTRQIFDEINTTDDLHHAVFNTADCISVIILCLWCSSYMLRPLHHHHQGVYTTAYKYSKFCQRWPCVELYMISWIKMAQNV